MLKFAIWRMYRKSAMGPGVLELLVTLEKCPDVYGVGIKFMAIEIRSDLK